MANILDRYGIKEVADVTFYTINKDGSRGTPVLYLDTLKVSTVEQTAEQTEARGGKGNPPLVIWDYGKEINVTLEDALFSAKSMAIMFGNGTVKNFDSDENIIYKTEHFKFKHPPVDKENPTEADYGAPETWTTPKGDKIPTGVGTTTDNPSHEYYKASGEKIANIKTYNGEDGEIIYITFPVKAAGSIIEVSANSFPDAYYVTGDTYARSEITGQDEFFQFIIPKAKVQSENTITLEAEGDPSVFNMSLRVMRPDNGVMMKLVKYELKNS